MSYGLPYVTRPRYLGRLFLGTEDVAFLTLLSLCPGEVLIVDVLGDTHSRHIDLCGGEEIPLVDPPEWAAVELVGPCDQQQAGGKLLQHDHALSFMNSSQEDCNNSRGKGGPQLPGVTTEVPLACASSRLLLSGIVIG